MVNLDDQLSVEEIVRGSQQSQVTSARHELKGDGEHALLLPVLLDEGQGLLGDPTGVTDNVLTVDVDTPHHVIPRDRVVIPDGETESVSDFVKLDFELLVPFRLAIILDCLRSVQLKFILLTGL